jgi:hypothetical protein
MQLVIDLEQIQTVQNQLISQVTIINQVWNINFIKPQNKQKFER